MTLAELEAWLNRLQNRITALATSAQVNQLRDAVNSYKSGTDGRLNLIEGRLSSHDAQLGDHELRLQELEA
jgi:hypothetical protein